MMGNAGQKRLRVGVFDSGFGGLTVLRALLPLIPRAHYIYVGDTARLPYGAKSQATIARYAVESARFLEEQGADRLVIACNTASALALPEIRAAVKVPVSGVIGPGARAAQQAAMARPSDATERAPILVLATAATVQSHAYRQACADAGLPVHEKACPLLVPLVEEGWTDHAVTREVLRIYLGEALREMQAAFGSAAGSAMVQPRAVLLGCTHYPLIAGAIRQELVKLGVAAPLVDSAEATAHEVAAAVRAGAGNPFEPAAAGGIAAAADASFECYATDSVEKFARLGSVFLGRSIPGVHLLDLGG